MTDLDQLLQDILNNGQEEWPRVYEMILGHPISDIKRFFRATEQFGDWIIFDAIVTTSFRKISGDPLNYILTVAHSAWRDQMQSSFEEVKQESYVNRQIVESKKESQKLYSKIEEAKRRIHADSI